MHAAQPSGSHARVRRLPAAGRPPIDMGNAFRARGTRIAVGLLAYSLAACGGSDAGGMAASSVAGSGGPTLCPAGEQRQCPCIGTSQTGTQVCEASGTRYGACTGCPAAKDGGAAGSGGAPSPAAGRDAASGSDAGRDGGLGEGTSDSGALLDVGNAAPGVWCGVGLPALCALETEKCCGRSIAVDSCIGASETCECDLPDCEVLEARCDGPEDCSNGQVCCGTLEAGQQGGTHYTSFTCAAQCSLMQNRPEACHTSEQTCPSGLACANSQILANVQICIDPETIEQ